MERTFDHEIVKNIPEHRQNVSMTEGSIKRKKSVVARYQSKMANAQSNNIEQKRVSTEHLFEVFPQDCSPEMITDKTENSFVSNSSLKNSPIQDMETNNRIKFERFKRSQSRKESRILIQTLPKLTTKSKYEDFRQARSIDRKQCMSMRSQIASLKVLKPNPVIDLSQRLTKGSFNNQDRSLNYRSSMASPTTCSKTGNKKKELLNSIERTFRNGGLKLDSRDTTSSGVTRPSKFIETTLKKQEGNISEKKQNKMFKKAN